MSNLEKLTFGEYFNQEINSLSTLCNLKYLTFGLFFNWNLLYLNFEGFDDQGRRYDKDGIFFPDDTIGLWTNRYIKKILYVLSFNKYLRFVSQNCLLTVHLQADRPIQGILYKPVGVLLRNETLVKHTSVHEFEIKIEPQSNGIRSRCSISSEMDTC